MPLSPKTCMHTVLLAGALLFAAGYAWLWYSYLHSPLVEMVVKRAEQSQTVQRDLGTPLEVGWGYRILFRATRTQSYNWLVLPVKGPKGELLLKAKVYPKGVGYTIGALKLFYPTSKPVSLLREGAQKSFK